MKGKIFKLLIEIESVEAHASHRIFSEDLQNRISEVLDELGDKKIKED